MTRNDAYPGWPTTLGWVLDRRHRGLWHRFLIWVEARRG